MGISTVDSNRCDTSKGAGQLVRVGEIVARDLCVATVCNRRSWGKFHQLLLGLRLQHMLTKNDASVALSRFDATIKIRQPDNLHALSETQSQHHKKVLAVVLYIRGH